MKTENRSAVSEPILAMRSEKQQSSDNITIILIIECRLFFRPLSVMIITEQVMQQAINADRVLPIIRVTHPITIPPK
jgi:hypothetical protein